MTTSWLIVLFAAAAMAYASAGFGGGSTYSALMVLAGVDYAAIPVVALTCNILVVSGGLPQFIRAGVFSWRSLAPYITLSVPMAWFGGRLAITEAVFAGVLGLALLVAALHLMLPRLQRPAPLGGVAPGDWSVGLPAGGLIGLVSGMVGVGGGVFLAPLLYLMGTHGARRIAALTSGFILVNSVAGLAGHLTKQGATAPLDAWLQAWPLYLAVVLGGQVGSHLGAWRLPEAWIRRLTALLVFYVAARLLWRWGHWVL